MTTRSMNATQDEDSELDGDDGDFTTHINRESLVTVPGAYIEESVVKDEPGSSYQFERTGYFVSDAIDSAPGHPVFNRTVTLRDSWAKVQK